MSPHLTFILGGARSGKSRLAEQLARAARLEKIYIATAEAYDEEMRERIAKHRSDRGADWTTIDAPIALASMLRTHAAPTNILLVDCLTLWLSNIMLAERDVEAEIEALRTCTERLRGPAIVVSNEVGLGIVPDNALARRFRDWQGRLNQMIAAEADRVIFVAAGLPLVMKGPALDAAAGSAE
ncbi:bifunctional adenosylcobinamide kinase/adenosylcobinamide-phosphate guanylyltransferase [Terrarubrum flagellatum]|uniref:bifunctional adenosylcobinamide kinase/adenosylcobinamide-phosphate guanylyltransferase n=1 Tax=Terrirubrum flagellatum TaxID=2895980 RepID=UPI00314559BB